MEKTTSKWLMGCGIGCGAIIIIAIIVIVGAYFFVKDKVDYVKEIEATSEELEDRYGQVRDFTPDPSGAISPDRIETFLTIRENTEFLRNRMERHFESFSGDIEDVEQEDESFWTIVNLVKKGIGIIPKIVEYYRERNEILLGEGMGLGEYYYIYVIGYYSWLNKSIEDGPKFPLMDSDEFGNFKWQNFDENYQDYEEFGEDVRDKRKRRIIRKIHRVIVPMMERQLRELMDEQNRDSAWQNTLESEIELLDESSRRIPWEDGLPEVIEISLQPYRDRFETSYNAMVNPLEIGGKN